jgi:hypothetical protein
LAGSNLPTAPCSGSWQRVQKPSGSTERKGCRRAAWLSPPQAALGAPKCRSLDSESLGPRTRRKGRDLAYPGGGGLSRGWQRCALAPLGRRGCRHLAALSPFHSPDVSPFLFPCHTRPDQGGMRRGQVILASTDASTPLEGRLHEPLKRLAGLGASRARDRASRQRAKAAELRNLHKDC